MNNQSANVYIQLKPFWQRPFLKYVILIIALSLLLVSAFPYLKNFRKVPNQNEATGMNKQFEGKPKSYRNDFLEKKIIIETGGQNTFFQITDSTIIYKCTDFSDINSCTITDQGIKNSPEVQVFAKGETALFILYK